MAPPTFCTPVTLLPRVGQLLPQSGTAEDLSGLMNWLAKPVCALKEVLGSAFLQVR
jgi:hypothetical protein